MFIGAAELVRITDYVWSTVLEFDLEELPDGAGPRDGLTGCVWIHGAWEGAVLLECDRDLARQAAAVMFERDAAQVSEHDLRDAIGELINMVGGNIKSLLPAPSELSLPVVDVEPPPLGRVVSRQRFGSRGQVLRVTLHRVEGPAPGGRPDDGGRRLPA